MVTPRLTQPDCGKVEERSSNRNTEESDSVVVVADRHTGFGAALMRRGHAEQRKHQVPDVNVGRRDSHRRR